MSNTDDEVIVVYPYDENKTSNRNAHTSALNILSVAKTTVRREKTSIKISVKVGFDFVYFKGIVDYYQFLNYLNSNASVLL